MLFTSGRSLKLLRSFLVLLLQVQLAFGLNLTFGDAQIRCIRKERQATSVSLFQNSVSNGLPWLTKEDCCEWEVVQCSNLTSRVIAIHVMPQTVIGLSPPLGVIDHSQIELQQLESFNLSFNYVDQITPFVGFLGNLRYLDLSNTDVSGTIPIELGNLFHLQYFDLSRISYAQVQNLIWLSSLSSLEFLDLCMFNLTIVDELDLHQNRPTSLIFPWLFNHSSTEIFYLDVSDNQLDGLIPEAFGSMNLVKFLDLGHYQFQELVHDDMEFPLLKALDRSNNNRNGTVTEVIGNFSELEIVYVCGNSLKGTITTSMGSLGNIRAIAIMQQQVLWEIACVLYGRIPSNLCHFGHTQLFDLSGNNIRSGEIRKCLDNLTALTERSQNSNATIRIPYTSGSGSEDVYKDGFNVKSSMAKCTNTRIYMCCIDVLNNALAGQIPEEITHLVGLVSLNLLWNSLTGQIPRDIGGTQLQGFDPALHAWNRVLCGLPLKDCEAPEPEGSTHHEQGGNEEDGLIIGGFLYQHGDWIRCWILECYWDFDIQLLLEIQISEFLNTIYDFGFT
ncbi:hypothetical protein TIFTF001_001142 [Ficus carica]|uniref:Leucine-rich repeat-containing N-terminal plant-type domain-containing protein n=1 Tax=Ficus carica TaxID=3494 RepID=A0AA87Z098_FICCA|nr:hypothetical protein TIFTF001_001142 [Ficus carica]